VRYFMVLVLGIVVFIVAGCATIFTGSMQKMPLGSDPAGAKISPISVNAALEAQQH
jgi:hypothetical protein